MINEGIKTKRIHFDIVNLIFTGEFFDRREIKNNVDTGLEIVGLVGGNNKPVGGVGEGFGKFGIKIFMADIFGNGGDLDGETGNVTVINFNEVIKIELSLGKIVN